MNVAFNYYFITDTPHWIPHNQNRIENALKACISVCPLGQLGHASLMFTILSPFRDCVCEYETRKKPRVSAGYEVPPGRGLAPRRAALTTLTRCTQSVLGPAAHTGNMLTWGPHQKLPWSIGRLCTKKLRLLHLMLGLPGVKAVMAMEILHPDKVCSSSLVALFCPSLNIYFSPLLRCSAPDEDTIG